MSGQLNIRSDFHPWRIYSTIFSLDQLSDSDRGSLWVKLLEADKFKSNASGNMYQKLVTMENPGLEDAIQKDKVSERSNLFQSRRGEVQFAAEETKLANVLKAYGNQDLELSYCQGYNYIVSMLLYFVKDEEMTFWCLFSIMNVMEWRRYFLVNDPISSQV
jgi:hypothetical protein